MSETNSPDAPALLPCPFCGDGEVQFRDGPKKTIFVQCLHCACRTYDSPSKEIAAFYWNKRAALDPS